jgi:hypothetical protein
VLKFVKMSSNYPPRPPSNLPSLRVRNPRTEALYKRDVLWQITVPLVLAGVVVVGLMAWLIVTTVLNFSVGAAAASVWGDVSLVFLTLPTMVCGLTAFALVAGLVYVMQIVLREVPFLFKRVQDTVALVAYRVSSVAERVAGVFITADARWAGVKRTGRSLRARLSLRR